MMIWLLESFFTSATAGGFLLEFEWQQISSSLLDSSQYSGRSQQCYSLDSLHPSRYFQVLQVFGYCTKSTNYNWYNNHFHIPQLFQFPSMVEVLIPLFAFLSILLCDPLGQQSPQFCKFSLFCWLLLVLVIWPRLGDPFVSQSPRGVSGQILGYTIYLYGQTLIIIIIIIIIIILLRKILWFRIKLKDNKILFLG